MIDRAIVHLSPRSRRMLSRRSARRLIGGETLARACDLAARLNAEGKRVTLGLFGEDVMGEKEARSIAADQRRALEEIEMRHLDAALSVKPSALGLAVDEELCFELLLALAAAADEKGSAVLIDMERASATEATLRLYRHVRERGYDSVGVALQARLCRTPDDIQGLAELRPRISICKGSYEEAAEAVAPPGKVHELFLRAVSRSTDCASVLGISTHDRTLVEESRRLLCLAGRTRANYEFQTLLGVDPRLEAELLELGEPLRVYVPYGENWYPYVSRRKSRIG